jgi:maltose alpha-D-glucosyltransferase/alpha-amylase
MTSDDLARADELARRRMDLVAAVRRLARAGEGSPISRIHGDFHLGQVLVVSGDAHIIDFEGEPLRSLDERRAKSSPTRDVAGMLRSFHYAAAAMIGQRNVGPAQVSETRRDEFIAQFLTAVCEAFMSSYEAASGAGDDGIDRSLLDLFLVEKAAYELTYEAANRPSWVGVPLGGLAALARRILEWEQEDGP